MEQKQSLTPLPSPRAFVVWQAMSRDAGKSTSSLGLIDFDLLRVIGRGSYAKVLLVRLKKTERIYAMKVVKKELVNDDEVRLGCPQPLCADTYSTDMQTYLTGGCTYTSTRILIHFLRNTHQAQ